MAPSGAPGAGHKSSSISITSAPKNRSMIRFSRGMAEDSGVVREYPFTLEIMAKPIPVLPDVGSTNFWPGSSTPRSSASAIRFAAIRSFTAPNGLYHSSFP